MESIPTQFKILDLVREKLKAPGADPAGIRNVIDQFPELAYLGALGPNLADYIPSSSGVGGLGVGNQYVQLWKNIYGIVGDDLLVEEGLFSVLKKMNAFLDKIAPIADAEDLDALKAMEGELEVINETAENLKKIVDGVYDLVPNIGSSIGAGMEPRVNVGVGDTVPPSEVWVPRNFLHWKKPGDFAKALLQAAEASRDNRCLAYAYGYVVGYVSKAAGSPFFNSIVNGPYRLHWWRHRWVGNYGAAWVHGYYKSGATMSGDTPNPPYESWNNLCDAQLHKKIELPSIKPDELMKIIWEDGSFPSVLPPKIGECFMEAFRATYGEPVSGSHFKKEALNGAYLLTYLQLWFQTSGQGIGCNPLPPLVPPADCGSIPPWTDPTVPGDSGTATSPPEPSIEGDPDIGKIVSGIILALLGLLSLATGGLVAGAAAIAGGAKLIIDGATAVDWAKLRCDIYWYRLYLFNGLQALHEIMTLGGFAYPYAGELAQDTTTIELLGIPITFDSGKALTKSKRTGDNYPAKRWGGLISTWTSIPSGLERPSTVGYLSAAYPSFFADDTGANPLGNGKVREGGGWPYKQGVHSRFPVQFGNVVDNCLDVFAHLADDLPNWNLDADRGLAYFTWQFKNQTYTDPVEIEPEP